MSKSTFASSAPWVALGGTVAAVAVAVGVYVSGALFPESEPQSVAEGPSVATSPTDPAPAEVDQDVNAVAEDPQTPVLENEETAVAQPEPEVEPAPETQVVEEPLVTEDPSDADKTAPQENLETAMAQPEAEIEPAPETQVSDEPVATEEPSVADNATRQEDADIAAEDAAAATAPEFDIVRVAPDGQTLVAGSALGAQLVRIIIDGVEVGDATVDGTGKFVAFFELANSDQPRVVSLLSEGELGQAESRDQVIIAPSVQQAVAEEEPDTVVSDAETAAEQVAQADNTEASDASAPAQDVTVLDTEEVAPLKPSENRPDVADADTSSPDAASDATPTVRAEAPPEPLQDTETPAATELAALPATTDPATPTQPDVADAPAVILSTDDGVEVLQSAGREPEVLDQIALDAITYEDAGAVALTGRGSADEFVRVYIDNQPIRTTEVTPDGRWRVDLPDVDSGTYTLRVDAVDSEGTVTSRVESPFRREDPALLAQAIERGEAAATVQVVTVQPGNTLWAIARDRYGEGPAYVRVFEANRDRIRDPDLIYPGQVFSIPN